MENIEDKVDKLLGVSYQPRKRQVKKLSKGIMLLVALGCICAIGGGSALWIVTNNIEVSVTTGNMKWEYTDIVVAEESDLQDIGTISYEIIDSDISLTITGAYPGYIGQLYFKLHNIGDVKIKFSALNIPVDYSDWIYVGLSPENTVLNPDESSSDIFFFDIVIPDDVEMGQLFDFTIGLSATQLNEQPPPA